MNISVFGIGYVGTVSAACFAELGHNVTAVDVNEGKVAALAAGQAPVAEPGLEQIIVEAVENGRLKATSDPAAAMHETDLSLICVGTPSASTGDIDLSQLRRVCADIGRALRDKPGAHTVAIRSTAFPGTTEHELIPLLEQTSGRVLGSGLHVLYNPEFLREGSAVRDFFDPARTVIGEAVAGSGDALAEVYAAVAAPVVRTSLRAAEMVKYSDNAFHAVKIAFANEIGAICKRLDVNSHEVMEIFTLDTKLNLSPAYLRPGYAFGGSCLPKDLRAILFRARSLHLETPLLRSALDSNEYHKRQGLELVLAAGQRRVGLLGLAFKKGTDDLRESPLVELAELLVGKGYEVSIYEPNVVLQQLVGSNRAYIERVMPHLARLLKPSAEEVLANADTVVLGNADCVPAGLSHRLRPEQRVVDLCGLRSDFEALNGRYQGVAW